LSPRPGRKVRSANLPTVLDDLANGAIVSRGPTRMAVRRLPIA